MAEKVQFSEKEMLDERTMQRLMDISWEMDGEQLLRLYEASGCTMPNGLEQQCRNILRHSCRKPITNTLRKAMEIAACFLSVILLAGALTLCLSPEVRAAVSNWISGWEGGLYVYAPSGTDVTTPYYEYQISKLPEHYYLDAENYVPTGGMKIYRDADSNHLFYLLFCRKEEGTELALILTEEEHKTVCVNDVTADLYYFPDGSNNSSIVWEDPETNYLLHISGWFPEEQMIQLAESVEKTVCEEYIP